MTADSHVTNKRKILFLGVAIVVLLVFFNGGTSDRTPVVSAETRFVEYSAGGLQIMPASCGSIPNNLRFTFFVRFVEHWPGQCTGSPPPGGGGDGDGDGGGPGGGGSGGGGDGDGDGDAGSCPLGFTLIGSECVFTGCPAGYLWDGDACVPTNDQSCSVLLYCLGDDLYQRNLACEEVFVQNCPLGCLNGSCITPPPGTGEIRAIPALIRTEGTTEVSWEAYGMVQGSCTVTENNPDVSDSGSGSSGSFTSSSLRQQTIYTLTCVKQGGGLFTDSAVVNIVPVFQEQ